MPLVELDPLRLFAMTNAKIVALVISDTSEAAYLSGINWAAQLKALALWLAEALAYILGLRSFL